jgi:hypothetical protein
LDWANDNSHVNDSYDSDTDDTSADSEVFGTLSKMELPSNDETEKTMEDESWV